MFRRRHRDSDLDHEIQAHLDMLTQEYVRRGYSAQAAREAARRDFGGVEQMKERYRDQRGLPIVDVLARDVRFGARMLAKDKWLMLTAAVVLALGIAANNMVFTLVNAILLRDLPFDAPDRIVTLDMVHVLEGDQEGLSYPELQDWRMAAQTFEGLGAANETTVNLSDEGRAPERVVGAYVTANAFHLIGRRPALGRDFSPDDERAGAVPVVVLGYGVWQNRYALDPGVIGRTVKVNGVPSTVIGVMPDGFGFPVRSQVWQTVTFLPGARMDARSARVLDVFGRLEQDVSIEQASTELQAIAASLAERFPETNRDLTPRIRPYQDRGVGGRAQDTMPVLMGAVAFVLLIACANVANLLLARSAARSQEVSIRMALGANRGQIVRQLLVESVLLASVAGVGGLLLSLAAVRTVSDALNSMPGGLPYWLTFTMDARVFAFLATVCLGTAILCGLLPALHTSNTRISRSLGQFSHGATDSVERRRWAGTLVVVQLALAPILLTGGGLMVRSMFAQYAMSPGVETSGVLVARVDLREEKYVSAEAKSQFYRELDARLAAAPGLRAALASNTPFGEGALRDLWRDNEPISEAPNRPPVWMVTIGPRYFDTLGARIVRGSAFPEIGSLQGEAEAVVSERLAEIHFDNDNPIGRRILLTERRGGAPRDSWFTIRGIVQNIRQRETEAGTGMDPVAYVLKGANPLSGATILARPTLDTAAAARALRDHLAAIDPDLPLFNVMTLDDLLRLSDERVGLRVFGGMFAVFAAIALILATVGLYGVTAYAAAQQTREIGVRMAFGAGGREIWWLVTRRAFRHLRIGLSIGIVGSVGLNILLGNALVGLRGPVDPATLAGVVLLLAATSLAACYGPARRATRLDPVVALRTE